MPTALTRVYASFLRPFISVLLLGIPLGARADAPVDRPLGKTFTFEKGISIRINSIQTVARADGWVPTEATS